MKHKLVEALKGIFGKVDFLRALNNNKFNDGYNFTSYDIIILNGIIPAFLPRFPDTLHYYIGDKHGCLISEISKNGLILSKNWDEEADKAAKVFIDRLKQYTKIYK